MTALAIFDYSGQTVRTVMIDGEPWFVAADVCDVLGYANSRDAVSKHVPESRKRVSRIATPSGEQQMTVIDEPGLYRLIMRSNAAGAEAFHGTAWQGKAGKARPGVARRGMAGTAWLGTARQAWRGEARLGVARLGEAGNQRKEKPPVCSRGHLTIPQIEG
jgi:hypothetical protein